MKNTSLHTNFLQFANVSVLAFLVAFIGSFLAVDSAFAIAAPPIAIQDKSDDKKEEDQDDDKKDRKKKSKDKDDSENSKKKKSDKKSDSEDNDKKSDGKKSDDKESDDKKSDGKKSKDKKKDADESSDEKGSSKSKSRRRSKRGFSKQDSDFVDVFKPVIGSVSASTVRVMGGRRQIAIGAIVDPEGYVLSKASEMRGDLKCKMADGKSYPAKVIGIDKENDFALLKIDAKDLPAVDLSTEPPPEMGRWLVTPLGNKDAMTIGVVAVNAREIPPSRAFVGIRMAALTKGPGIRITSVVPDSPADDAGVFVSDVILKVDDIDVMNIPGMHATLGQFSPDQQVTLTVQRGDEIIKLKLTLADSSKASPDNSRSNSQNQMGSSLSRRSKNFDLAFQHDSMLQANQCGGPIVDLTGRVVGFNIARAGRVSSLAIPVNGIPELIEKLKTGEFAPEVVNQDKITGQELMIAETMKSLTDDESKQAAIQEKLKIEQAKIEQLEKMQAEIKAKIEKMEAAEQALKSKFNSMNGRTKKQKRSLKTMKEYLDGLKSGRRY